MLECDVLVIGCGPAGASLAYYLAQKNVKVIVAEKKTNLDTPVRCAGFVPVNIAGLFDFKIAGINNQTEFLETYISRNQFEKFYLSSKISAPGFILDRDIFIKDMAKRFLQSGGLLLRGTRALSFKRINSGWITELSDKGSKNQKVKAKIIAGADGPVSITAKHIGSTNKSFTVAIQKNPEIIMKTASCNKIFFAPYITCGYGWLFPKYESINIGVGAINTTSPIKNTFFDFIRHLEFSGIFDGNINFFPPSEADRNNCNKKEGNHVISPGNHFGNAGDKGSLQTFIQDTQSITGLAPDSGIVENPGLAKGLVLCGDAAGLCHPVTGAGIFNAIYSSRLVSESIAKSLKLNDLAILNEIREVYNTEFANSINRALRKKLLQKSNWPACIPEYDKINNISQEDINDNLKFSGLVKRSWIAYRDYWH